MSVESSVKMTMQTLTIGKQLETAAAVAMENLPQEPSKLTVHINGCFVKSQVSSYAQVIVRHMNDEGQQCQFALTNS